MNTKKRVFLILLAAVICSACAFAQVFDEETGEYVEIPSAVPDYNKYETIEEKSGGLVIFKIEYWPAVDEARFSYSKPSTLFDQGDAYAAVVQRIMKFQLEHSYFGYTYMTRDQLHFEKDKNPERTVYSAYVKFER